jgi:hypothetical protein
MALTSPGVQVSVIDESFYTPAEPGTRPLFIVASAENKSNGAGTGTAPGTLAANAGRVYLITSQRDLVDTFGDPTFKVDSNNNPIHAGELNEYGLQAAYSYLGVSNSAFVVRADLDLGVLDPSADAPGGEPVDGTFWLDTAATSYGIFEWNGSAATTPGGQSFTNKAPTVILDESRKESDGTPIASIGAIGSYAITTAEQSSAHVVKLFYKSRFAEDGSNSGTASWVQVGTDEWVRAQGVITGTGTSSVTGNGAKLAVKINGGATQDIATSGTTIDSLVGDINGANIPGLGARKVDNVLQIFADNVDVETISIESSTTGALLTAAGLTAGTYKAPKLLIQPHTNVPQWKRSGQAGQSYNNGQATGSVWIKSTEPNLGARWRVKVYNGATQLWDAVEAPMYATGQAANAALDSSGGFDIPTNSVYVQFNFNEVPKQVAEFRVMRRIKTGTTTMRTVAIGSGTVPASDYTMSVAGSKADGTFDEKTVGPFILAGTSADANTLAAAINSANIENVTASVDSTNRVVIEHAQGGEIRFADFGDSTNFIAAELGLDDNTNVYVLGDDVQTYEYVASNWVRLPITDANQVYYISDDAPSTLVEDGRLWYSSVVDEVDLLVHNGTTWVGYGNVYSNTDPNGPIVSATAPTTFSDGVTDIDADADGQIWIDTSDIDNYPVIKRWNADFQRWDTLDKTDQTTENGVLFADARFGTSGGSANTAPSGTIAELWASNFLDVDAPDPALYPQGMILWNLRRSGFNVKRFVRNYVDLTADNIRMPGQPPMSGYYPHRWVTESGNQADGSGSFGRKAQRKVVIQSLQALVNSNEDIRDTEVRTFNLIAAPGYPELIGEMVSLNYDRGLTAFVVGDTPPRLRPDATTINDWGNNVALSLQDDDDGLVSFDEYLGVFYPWGFTSDNAGRDIAVPPSHMILRMMALSDQVSYPWFAPAGTRRGGITNATAVGYVDSEGEFVSVALNEGQRDTLYNVKVNPITFFTGAGLVNFGQKTRARNASALDRINVARLVIYLRSQLNKLAKPYIFEPNDKITRDEIKQQVETLLLELVGQRALYDFLVVCDESNNTPNRIDRNELYVDIAIEPVKAVEFIYIPVRLKNTGEIAGLG